MSRCCPTLNVKSACCTPPSCCTPGPQGPPGPAGPTLNSATFVFTNGPVGPVVSSSEAGQYLTSAGLVSGSFVGAVVPYTTTSATISVATVLTSDTDSGTVTVTVRAGLLTLYTDAFPVGPTWTVSGPVAVITGFTQADALYVTAETSAAGIEANVVVTLALVSSS